jgi:hypothetical protein
MPLLAIEFYAGIGALYFSFYFFFFVSDYHIQVDCIVHFHAAASMAPSSEPTTGTALLVTSMTLIMDRASSNE